MHQKDFGLGPPSATSAPASVVPVIEDRPMFIMEVTKSLSSTENLASVYFAIIPQPAWKRRSDFSTSVLTMILKGLFPSSQRIRGCWQMIRRN
ncbi:Hypothetical predicted protein [Podarcis lilfordi]|uniref:Uncharacterized protein n=1 Tax=Podarcis lilfordi TaxID=74358 RepID=A0AA35KX76_9SAUR|nr:Hypothetical predicted protein [Podarcis lilfordi]